MSFSPPSFSSTSCYLFIPKLALSTTPIHLNVTLTKHEGLSPYSSHIEASRLTVEAENDEYSPLFSIFGIIVAMPSVIWMKKHSM